MPLPKRSRPSFAFCLTAAKGKSMTPKIPAIAIFIPVIAGFFLSLRAQRSNCFVVPPRNDNGIMR
jgi:hypothetical protein